MEWIPGVIAVLVSSGSVAWSYRLTRRCDDFAEYRRKMEDRISDLEHRLEIAESLTGWKVWRRLDPGNGR